MTATRPILDIRPDPAEIRRALELLLPRGQVTELRALGVVTPEYRRPHTVSGYFDDPDALVRSAVTLAPNAQGAYIVPNPVNRALLARASNRVRPMTERDASTSDTDIIVRRWLLIDADPRRPSGISSTDVEHTAALDRVHLIRDALTASGWPRPIVADSGNGAHLLYAIDLPVDDGGLVKRALAALAFRFDDETVGIDQVVFNPARIWKLYGTPARKGDSTADRPHRLAHLGDAVTTDGPLTRVPSELLKALAASVPTPPVPPRGAERPIAGAFDLDRWIETHAVDVGPPMSWQGGRRWVFDVCPWNPDHRNRSAYIVQFQGGAIAAGCHHNGCAGGSWQTLRDLLEPVRRFVPGAALGSSSPPTPQSGREIDRGRSGPTENKDTRPEIDASELDLPAITGRAWDVLLAANNPPVLYRQGGQIIRIERDEDEQPLVRLVTRDRLRHRLARVARWTRPRRGGDGVDTTLPPGHVVGDMLAMPDAPLPVLARIVEAPVFAANGTLQTAPGYHASSRSFYAPSSGLTVSPIPDAPSADDVVAARRLILDELLGEFPFAGESEKAHAVSLLLLPFARELIDGPTPLHLIEKPAPGTGGSLLADMLVFPATGHPIAAMTEGRDEDEWRKRITAKLRSGSPISLIDNLRRPLDSAAVAAAITATVWEDRLLGVSELVHLPVRVVWAATGNNPALSNEMARRTVRVRLDAKVDHPWLRTGFRHPDLRGWARKHRAELVWAALVIGRAWLAAGRPRGRKTLGMFEAWAEVMGGMLAVAGIPGFLENLDEFYAASDTELAAWQVFFAAWWERFRDGAVGVADLVYVAETTDPPLDIGDGNERSQRTRLGILLSKMRDRQVRIRLARGRQGEVRLLDAGTEHNTQRWRLAPIGGDLGDVGGRFPALTAQTTQSGEPTHRDAPTENVPQVPQRPPGGVDGLALGEPLGTPS